MVKSELSWRVLRPLLDFAQKFPCSACEAAQESRRPSLRCSSPGSHHALCSCRQRCQRCCPEMQPLRFHLKRRKTLVCPSQESQEFGEGNVEGEEKPLHPQCHPVPFFLILSKLVPGGTGSDRENASFGVDVASCINCCCSFFLSCFSLPNSFPPRATSRRTWAELRSSVLTLSCPEGVRGGQ